MIHIEFGRYSGAMDTETFFRALADPTRLRCMLLLVGHDELCVCELTHALGLPQPKISHHLGALRRAGLVTDRKAGLWVYYRLPCGLPAWAQALLSEAEQGLSGEPPFAADREALAGMPNRPGARCSA
jgi:ArsR family transcriptional regulator